ncbi:MAG: pilus assembly protein [Anaerolineales bacterium]|nr:pilus assembly protein [Anaerolineales bacterium]
MSGFRKENGQGFVEFAVGITFLLILLAGILDLGRAYFSYIALQDAAQEGASYASIAPTDITGIRERVRATSSGPIDFLPFDDSQITVQFLGGFCTGSGVKVTVQIDFRLVAPFFSGNSLALSAEATDTILQDSCG